MLEKPLKASVPPIPLWREFSLVWHTAILLQISNFAKCHELGKFAAMSQPIHLLQIVLMKLPNFFWNQLSYHQRVLSLPFLGGVLVKYILAHAYGGHTNVFCIGLDMFSHHPYTTTCNLYSWDKLWDYHQYIYIRLFRYLKHLSHYMCTQNSYEEESLRKTSF